MKETKELLKFPDLEENVVQILHSSTDMKEKMKGIIDVEGNVKKILDE